MQEDTSSSEDNELEERKEQPIDKPIRMRRNSSTNLALCQKSVYLSILQIYNEQTSDLLSEGKGEPRKLKISLNQNKTWYAEGVTEKLV